MADNKLFKELEIGFRELFRIVIPGAYFVSLAQVIATDSEFSKLIIQNTASGLAATFFLGLICYALRPHERWFPYFLYFEKQRSALNDEIARITGLSPQTDNVGVYKYFLETEVAEFSDRIHYFSSFYYMLIELSLLSAAGAYFMMASALFHSVVPLHRRTAVTGVVLISIAGAIQLCALFPLTSVRTHLTRILLFVEGFIGIVGIAWLTVMSLCNRVFLVSFRAAGWTALLLVITAYLFWRLADKHWKQIIGEQIALVNVRAGELIKSAETYTRKQPSEPTGSK